MTLSIMLYGVVLGLLLSGAAHFLDRGLRALGRPTRWIWVAAMAGTALVPLGSLLLQRSHGRGAVSGTVIPLDALYDLWAGPALQSSGSVSFLHALNHPLLLAWVSASLLVLLLFVGTALRLRTRSRRWPRGNAGGEEVLISDGLGPAVLGLLNPRIVLPPWALTLGADELGIVLLHEGEHREARDPALLAGGILMVALAPWNPALWWGLRNLRLAVEGDCDGRVLATGVPRKTYGNLLLALASSSDGLFPLAPALVEGGSTFLERRLRMMVSNVGRKRIGGAVAAVAAGGLFLALACETPTPPQAGLESVQEPATREAMDGAGEAGSPWALAEGVDPGTTITGEKVLLKRVTEDGAVLIEAGQAELRPDENVTLNDGVKIRIAEAPAGARKIMDAMPLVIVDGVIIADGSAKTIIEGLDPDLIESIEIIKGAAAEALYGERAADGVIQIRTKR